MTKKIFRSAFFTSILAVISCLLLIMGVLYGFFEGRIDKELEGEADYVAYAIKDDYQKFFENFSSGENRITLIAKDGTVLADTQKKPSEMDNHSDRKEFSEAEEYGSGTSVRYSETMTEKTIYYAKKLENGNVLRVSTTQYTIFSVIMGLLQPLIFVILIVLVIAFLLSRMAAKSILKPLNEFDPDHPETFEGYEELSPFLRKISSQRRTIERQVEQAKQKQNEFRLITENMHEGFLVIDKNASVLSENHAALELFDLETAPKTVFEMNRTEGFLKTIETALSGKRAENLMSHTGRTYSLIANPVQNGKNTIGAVIIIIDITESEKQETMRREFTANVSHELKTPLTSISGFAELMKNGGMDEATVKDFSNSIYSEAQRLIALVGDIINLSCLDEGEGKFDKKAVDLKEIAENTVSRLKPFAAQKQVTLKSNLEKAEIIGSAKILGEMIYNLADNAIKYNHPGGTAEIEVKNDGGKVRLTVCDNGIGIPDEDKDRIFERFYTVDKSRSKSEGGTGLGLSIVKHGAMLHNAEISLKSRIGEGTEITITF